MTCNPSVVLLIFILVIKILVQATLKLSLPPTIIIIQCLALVVLLCQWTVTRPIFATTSQSNSGVDFSIPSTFTTNILIHSQMGNANLSQDIVLGVTRQQTNKDQSILDETVRATAKNLSDAFNYSHSRQHHSPFISLSTNANHPQSSEILAPFLDHDQCASSIPFISPSLDHPRAISSSEYLLELFHALELDTPSYGHVPSHIMTAFKQLISRYRHVFIFRISLYLRSSASSTTLILGMHTPTKLCPLSYQLTPYQQISMLSS